MIDLPPPVLSYLQDEDIATAVDTLLAPKQTIPARLGWDEVPAYFRAVGAAQQVKVEYVLALERFWNLVWGEAVSGLIPVSVDDQDEEGGLYSFDDCWSDGAFDRCFALSDAQWLWTEAGFDRDNAYLLARIDGMKVKALRSRLPGFDLSDGGEWVKLIVGEVLEEGTVETLQDGARRVVAIAQAAQVTGGSSTS